MEATPQGNETKPSKLAVKAEKNTLGWAGFIVTIGILLYQIYVHGFPLFDYYIPAVISGDFFLNFSTTDPLYGALFKTVFALGTLNDVFLAVILPVTLVFLLLRKRSTPTLLMIFVAFAGLFSLFVSLILSNLLPVEVSQVTLFYNIQSAVFLAVDILLFFFYMKSKKFRMLFKK
jgi:hypothetical protein